ncbi:MAG: hypothetical protein H6R10_3116 [Rhodocyclaceae bacterium]|nr:hypothetical protein [Rhodocyclaceae bacterium]
MIWKFSALGLLVAGFLGAGSSALSFAEETPAPAAAALPEAAPLQLSHRQMHRMLAASSGERSRNPSQPEGRQERADTPPAPSQREMQQQLKPLTAPNR